MSEPVEENQAESPRPDADSQSATVDNVNADTGEVTGQEQMAEEAEVVASEGQEENSARDDEEATEPAETEEAAAVAATEETEATPAEEAAAEETESAPVDEAAAEETKAAPAEETEAAPAEETEAAPAEETDAAPAEETDAAPAEDTQAAPAEETEASPAKETDAAPAEETDAAPAEETEAAPAEETEAAAEDTEAAPAEETEAAAAEETEAAPAEETEAAAAKDTETAAAEETEAAPADEAAAEAGSDSPRRISPRNNEGEGGEQVDRDDRPAIPDDFFYDNSDFTSGPKITADSGLPDHLVELCFSFGYDCKRRDNLHLLDKDNVCFVAGNLVKILNLNTKEQKYLRSCSGGAVGAVAVHPSRKFLAVAEKGEAPNTLVYAYPSLQLHRVLRGGTQKAYAYCKFNKEGTYLATVGSEPDFMLTIWDWKSEQTVLRSKAFSQDVFRVSWSQDLEGFLTTAGTGHIRFWKMASTFTGLKLQGAIGKFGKTEISDIEGFVELPDGKVLSGCEWGNMLVWDGGLIKVEISKKSKKPAHQAPIFQVVMDAGELMTVGLDGLIQTWDFEMIDTAEAADESGLLEMEPMNAYQVGSGVQLAHIVKQIGSEGDDGSADWLAQDSNGGIWRLDLSFSHTAQPPERLLSCHAGPIVACDVSPVSHLVASVGQDGSVRVADFAAQSQLAESRFNQEGTALLWAPTSLDPKGRTIFCGFADGVLRVLNFGENPEAERKAKQVAELALVAALKPHSGAVLHVAANSAGDLLATVGLEHHHHNDNNNNKPNNNNNQEDEVLSSVFFFSVSSTQYNPIGFIRFSGRPVQVSWLPADSSDSERVRVFLADGRVCDFDCPDPASVDNSVTFELQGCSMQQRFSFVSVKSQLRRKEELEELHRLEAEELKKRTEERKRKLERGMQTEEEQAKEVEEETKEIAKRRAEEQEWEPYTPEEPSPLQFGLVSSSSSFWLSLGGYDAGYFYECEYPADFVAASFEEARREPKRATPVKESRDVPVTAVSFSSSGKRAFFGLADGSVRVQLLEEAFDLSSMSAQWQLAMHDSDHGEVTSIRSSFDDAFLLSVGRDGNFFVYRLMSEDLQQQAMDDAAKAKLPSARRADQKLGDDIDDPGAYSIEEDKQKSEHDRKVKLAEEKKAGIRRRVNELRVEYRKLKEHNQSLPERIQLRSREFDMVPQLKVDQQQQRQQKMQMVEREMAWEHERCCIALKKLQQRFLNDLECELVVVKAVGSEQEVTSIRMSKLTEAFNRLRDEMERKRTMASVRDTTRDPTLLANTDLDGDTSAEKEEDEQPLLKANLRGARGERILRQLKKVEEKKRRRQQRRQQWNELHRCRPSDDYDDPQDVLDIQEARSNMGDYKLKSAGDYVVPPHLRLSSDKARQKLLDLDETTHSRQCNFNKRLLQLRDRKIELVQMVNAKLDELQQLQETLPPEQRLQLPMRLEMQHDEMPERKFDYTTDSLMEFKAEMEAKATAAVTGEEEQGFSGFKKNKKQRKTRPAAAAAAAPTAGQSAVNMNNQFNSQVTNSSGAADSAAADAAAEGSSELSQLQQQRLQAATVRALYRQKQLLKQVQDSIMSFDCELRLLRHEKFDLDAKLKRAELRQITLFEEYQLLKQFEMSESTLANRVEEKGEEKIDVQNKLVDCNARIEAKKKDIERVQEKDRQLFEKFKESLGEGNKFADYLTKVFKKRIKRKKNEREGDDADAESESESESDDDYESEEEESDGEGVRYDLDICPAGCDQNLYDNTCALREHRLDSEEELAEERKVMEALRKELETLQKKARMVDTALLQAEKELEAFQLEKQSKLNELETIVVLRLNQLLHHVDGQLPQEIADCLIFERGTLLRLKNRIEELQVEKHQQSKQQKEAKRKNIQLNKDRRLYQQHIDDMKVKCDKMMIDKFGKVEDMEKLEQIVINPRIEELTVKMFVQQEKMLDEVNEWDDKIRSAKDRLIEQTKENTKKLSQTLMLYNERVELEQQIQSRQKNLGSEYQGAREADIEEIEKLMQLVQIQAQELNALKEEIGLLTRKGGHILPPVQPPMHGGL